MLESIPQGYYIALSVVLFSIGTIGVVTRRNAIIIFMSIELMLNSVNLALVTFSSFSGDISGQLFVFFVMAVAAAEAAIGLAIVLTLFRNKKTIYVDQVNVMKW